MLSSHALFYGWFQMKNRDRQDLSRNLASPSGAVFVGTGFKCLLAFWTAEIISASFVFSLERRLFHFEGHFANRAHTFLGHVFYLLHFIFIYNIHMLIFAIRKCLIFGFEKPEANINNGIKKSPGPQNTPRRSGLLNTM